MSERPDKRQRKEKLDAWWAQQRAAAGAKFPLPNEQMRALFDFLSAEFPTRGYDHTLRLTRRWLEAEGLECEPVIAWLHDNGGYCDCEALANSEEAWRDAMRDIRQ